MSEPFPMCQKCDGRGRLRRNRTLPNGRYQFGFEPCDECHGSGYSVPFSRKKWKRIQVQIQKRQNRGQSNGCLPVPVLDVEP